MKLRPPSIYKTKRMHNLTTLVSFASAIIAFVTVLAPLFYEPINKHIKLLIAFWLLAPPAWFWCEYIFLFDDKKDSDNLVPDKFERLKYRQALARNIWAAILAFLFAIFFKTA